MSPAVADAVPAAAPALDAEAFLREVRELRREVEAKLGQEDIAHLRKIERWGWAASGMGWATAWVAPNPLSMAALSLGRSTRWLLMHHVGHRGYDKVPGIPARYTSRVFARGARRYLDWPDWMLPEAWIYEHNVLHHSYVCEEKDPDLLERNTEALRRSSAPEALKLGLMGLLALSWRPVYYAPNTMRTWLGRHRAAASEASGGDDDAPAGGEGTGAPSAAARGPAMAPSVEAGAPRSADPPGYSRTLWLRCYLPYAALEFGALPLAYLPLGPWASFSVLVNSLGAEVLTNLHTFIVVGPNHTGDDLQRFDRRPASRAEAMVRQVTGSVNYAVGGDLVDFAHLWLNYQIEHHVWPDLPMTRYRELQPRLKALCERHGIPYVQEGVFTRVRKMLAVTVGRASMLRGEGPRATGAAAVVPSPG